MRSAISVLLLVALPGALTSMAAAEPLEALTAEGRYQLMEVNDKVVRLDTQTGRFELCRMQDGDWKCLAAQDERQRLEDTIAALTKRVAALESAQSAAVSARAIPTVQIAPAPAPAGSGVSQVADASPTAPMPAAPMPATPVPTASVPPSSGQTAPAATEPVAAGKPFDISPAATAADEKPGLIGRITGLIPGIGW